MLGTHARHSTTFDTASPLSFTLRFRFLSSSPNLNLSHFTRLTMSNRRIGFHLIEGEELRTCPYDKNHYALTTKIDRHISKCRDRYMVQLIKKKVPVDMVTCPLNELHCIPEVEMNYHQKYCMDKEQHFAPLQAADFNKSQYEVPCGPPPNANPLTPAAYVTLDMDPKDRFLPRHVLWAKLNAKWDKEMEEKMAKLQIAKPVPRPWVFDPFAEDAEAKKEQQNETETKKN